MKAEELRIGMRVEIANAPANPYYLREGIVLSLRHEWTDKEFIRICLDDDDAAEVITGLRASDLERI